MEQFKILHAQIVLLKYMEYLNDSYLIPLETDQN